MIYIRVLSLAALAFVLPLAVPAWATPVVGPSGEAEPASTSPPAFDAADFASQTPGLLAIESTLETNLLPSEGESFASGASSLFELAALGSDTQQQGETLDQVLRSVTVVHQAGASSTVQAGARRLASADADDSGDDWVGVREMILNSTFAGNALQSVLEAHADGDAPAGFSVFGFGSFVLEATAGGGSLELTDASNGWSVMLTGERGASEDGASAREAAPDSDVKKVAFARWLLLLVDSFLVSPLGILLETIGVLVLMFWLVIQGIAMARLSRSPTARLARRRRAPEAAAARRARHRTRRRRRRGVRSSVA